MKDIVFENELITQDIPAGKPHTYWFKGYNLSDKVITRTTLESSCSCTITNIQKTFQPKESFTFEMIFDPQGTSGFYAKSIKFDLDNGQKIKLRINGKIIEQEVNDSGNDNDNSVNPDAQT
jgi:hypothetical protein